MVARDKESSSHTLRLIRHYFAASSSLIPFSRRPAIYRAMACIAMRRKDFVGLIQIGKQLGKELKTVWSSAKPSAILQQSIVTGSNEPSKNANYKDQLLIEATVYQILGLRALNKGNEADAFERKHRHVLKRCPGRVAAIEEMMHSKAIGRTITSDPRICDSYPDKNASAENDRKIFTNQNKATVKNGTFFLFHIISTL